MVSAANPNDIEKAKEILKAALARPVTERLARLKASGIVDSNGQIATPEEQANGSAATRTNGTKPTKGKHS